VLFILSVTVGHIRLSAAFAARSREGKFLAALSGDGDAATRKSRERDWKARIIRAAGKYVPREIPASIKIPYLATRLKTASRKAGREGEGDRQLAQPGEQLLRLLRLRHSCRATQCDAKSEFHSGAELAPRVHLSLLRDFSHHGDFYLSKHGAAKTRRTRENAISPIPSFSFPFSLLLSFLSQSSGNRLHQDPIAAVIFQNTRRRLKCRVLAAKFVTSAIDRQTRSATLQHAMGGGGGEIKSHVACATDRRI